MSITKTVFGTTPDNAVVDRYTLTNANGLEADIITLGGIITALRVPDRNGTFGDVLLGFDTLEPYLKPNPYFGTLVGRFANRIANGTFMLNGKTYHVAKNDGQNHLHGGIEGFHRAIWHAEVGESNGNPTLTLRHHSPDGDEGYPGNLDAAVVYSLTDRNELQIEYSATTDQDTIINLTNHAYFNLGSASDILGHVLQIPASRYIPTDASSIPLGEIAPVANTPMDFTRPTPIGARINDDDLQLRNGIGYDHTWVFDKPAGSLAPAARVSEPTSGRVMDVMTTEPGVQFYSGNHLNGTVAGKNGQIYQQRSGLCLETQHFPDSPNQPQFPSVVLHPGETYRQLTIYRFSVEP